MTIPELAMLLEQQAEEAEKHLEHYRVPGSMVYSDHDGSVERLGEQVRVLRIVAAALRAAEGKSGA